MLVVLALKKGICRVKAHVVYIASYKAARANNRDLPAPRKQIQTFKK